MIRQIHDWLATDRTRLAGLKLRNQHLRALDRLDPLQGIAGTAERDVRLLKSGVGLLPPPLSVAFVSPELIDRVVEFF